MTVWRRSVLHARQYYSGACAARNARFTISPRSGLVQRRPHRLRNKEQEMKQLKVAILVLGFAVAVGSTEAKQLSIDGAWTFSIEHIRLKLVLEEKGSVITGTLDWPHGDPLTLTGLLAGDRLVLSGDSAGENFTIHVDVTGVRKADGTLAGTLKAHFDEFN